MKGNEQRTVMKNNEGISFHDIARDAPLRRWHLSWHLRDEELAYENLEKKFFQVKEIRCSNGVEVRRLAGDKVWDNQESHGNVSLLFLTHLWSHRGIWDRELTASIKDLKDYSAC